MYSYLKPFLKPKFFLKVIYAIIMKALLWVFDVLLVPITKG